MAKCQACNGLGLLITAPADTAPADMDVAQPPEPETQQEVKKAPAPSVRRKTWGRR